MKKIRGDGESIYLTGERSEKEGLKRRVGQHAIRKMGGDQKSEAAARHIRSRREEGKNAKFPQGRGHIQQGKERSVTEKSQTAEKSTTYHRARTRRSSRRRATLRPF